jgi:hypothetical protein
MTFERHQLIHGCVIQLENKVSKNESLQRILVVVSDASYFN